MFYLLDQPTEKEFQDLACRYREMKPLAVKTAVTMLRTGSDLITGFEKLMGRYNLSQGRFLILVVMNRQPEERTSPSVLAEKIGVTRATMTRLIDGLERDGLIRRTPHKKDRRRQEINLSSRGRTLLEEILPDYWSRIDTLMQGLNETEQQTMLTLLAKVAGGIPALTEE